MLTIEKVDHVGIRISDKAASISFYQTLGFDLIADAGFERGHPRDHAEQGERNDHQSARP